MKLPLNLESVRGIGQGVNPNGRRAPSTGVPCPVPLTLPNSHAMSAVDYVIPGHRARLVVRTSCPALLEIGGYIWRRPNANKPYSSENNLETRLDMPRTPVCWL